VKIEEVADGFPSAAFLRTVPAFRRAGQCPVPRRGEASVSFKVSGRGKRLYRLSSVKVLIELLQKFADSKGRAFGRPSQWAKLSYTPKAQEGEQRQKICVDMVWEPSPGVPGRGVKL